MSIKDLFNKKSKSISAREKGTEDFSEVESLELAEERRKTELRFSPEVDFEDPSQFARYGLAEKYYKDAIEYVYKTYPYDGSFYEKEKWHNESSDLVNYFFEDKYPRNNGYINIGQNYGTSSTSDENYYSSSTNEYIHFRGTYNDGNKHDLEKNREYSLKIDGTEGNTVEFYFKRNNYSGSHKQVIFDVWNNEASGSDSYGRMTIEVHPGITGNKDKLYLQVSSGSYGHVNFELGSNLDFTGSWHHYAISYKNSGASIKAELLVDGDVVDTQTAGTNIGRIYGAMQGQIGSLVTTASNTTSTERGWGKLSGSLDEFRFWKKKRTDKDIALNYFCHVGGGTNTDDSNTDLGIYFKFNEGVFDSDAVSAYDKIVLDYSGRMSNGSWIGYSVGSRNTGSAIVQSGISSKEFKDPVVYSSHPEIISLMQSYSNIGYEYDIRNNASIYNSLPSWKIEEDQENGKATQNLMQIMSETFDDLHNKIKFLPTIKNIEYRGENPLAFSSKLLQNVGFEFIDIFNDVESIELFLDKNEVQEYENKIYKIKNVIYQNIYNNLINIYKSKGTKKSFRNFLHCFGIGEDLLKMQMYADDNEFEIRDRLRQSLVKKTGINFNNTDSFGGVIYQEENSSDSNSIGYIKASSDIMFFGSTLEVELFFPKKFEINDELYFPYSYYTSSLFGVHENDAGRWAATDRGQFQVFAVRNELESKDVYFQLSSSYLGIDIKTDTFTDVYDDKKWNLAVKIKPNKYPLAEYINGTTNDDFTVELYGTSYVQDIKEDSFIITASVDYSTMEDFYLSNKKVYVGSHRQDFTGSVVSTNSSETTKHYSDMEVFSVRYWNSYLENETIDMHAKTTNVYGAQDQNFRTAEQQFALQNSLISSSVEQNSTLALHWNYFNPTLTNGEFSLLDASSGSAEHVQEDYMGNYTENAHTGYGKFFSTDSLKVVRTNFINAADFELPENISPDDLIDIVSEYEDLFERERKFVNYFYSLEKSFYGTMSKEMLSWLGTVREFNNLLGNPKNRYSEKYEGLEVLRTLFFRNVENEPDFNRFVTFYKWIDDSISTMVEALIPASANFNPAVVNIVESHVLERNKYRHKLPTIEFIGDPPISTARGINELLYDWKYGHAPLSGLESDHCNWWAERAERTGSLNSERSAIFESIKQSVNRNFGTVYSLGSSGRIVVGRPQKPDLKGGLLTKISQKDIIINEAGFDLTGVKFIEISDIIPSFDDCDDE